MGSHILMEMPGAFDDPFVLHACLHSDTLVAIRNHRSNGSNTALFFTFVYHTSDEDEGVDEDASRFQRSLKRRSWLFMSTIQFLFLVSEEFSSVGSV